MFCPGSGYNAHTLLLSKMLPLRAYNTQMAQLGDKFTMIIS